MTLEELIGRAAIAIDNARLYRSLQREIVRSREAEEHLQDASRRKDEFLAMLSHELRNPLARSATRRADAPARSARAEANTWRGDIIDRQVAQLRAPGRRAARRLAHQPGQ